MSKTLKIYLLFFIILIAGMVIINQLRDKPLNWYPSYSIDDKNPLDLYVLNQEIDRLFEDSVTRCHDNPYQYITEHDTLGFKQQAFLFIDDFVYLDKVSIQKLLDLVNQGSTLFIASDGFNTILTDTLDVSFEAIYNYFSWNQSLNDNSVKLRFSNDTFSDTTYSYGPVFGGHGFVKSENPFVTAYGYMKLPDDIEYINFIEVKFGQGRVVLHNQPAVFSNYYLLSDEISQQYAERVMNYIPDQPVVWFVNSRKNDMSQKSILSVIFDYPSLRLTWLIFLFGIILFVIFMAKRKQRVVPIIKPLQNTTVEFVRTIGNLYYQEGDICDIAKKKTLFFLDRTRRTYNMEANMDDDNLADRLHLKSGRDMALIIELLDLMKKIDRNGSCDNKELLQLSTLVDRFWGED